MAIDDLSTIDASKENWCIIAKVNRLWLSPSLYGSKLPFSMDMILMDEKISFFGVGESGRDFRPTSHPFKINFDIHTSVRLVPNKTIDLSPYNFVPISDIMFKDLDTSFLIEFEKDGGKQKRITIELDQDGARVECAFFGKYVDEVVGYLGSADATNAVVVVSCVKVKPFKVKTSLQNVYGATKVIFNPLIEEAAPLRTRFLESHDSAVHVISPLQDSARKTTPEDDFLKQNDGKTIEQLKDLAEESKKDIKQVIDHLI
ncbi:uncharacterized protein LOC130748490 [Lotus japonicus]|uniref:uncharacterized protein LOC130748490 n=1 Tax=Lotus japonicus TaxID=34305 RepID=UPI002590E8A5|nr:uncharacterized protein LOC130748490 [Lotus japonicus]